MILVSVTTWISESSAWHCNSQAPLSGEIALRSIRKEEGYVNGSMDSHIHTHTHPDRVLSHCPINLTQGTDGSESRSVMGQDLL